MDLFSLRIWKVLFFFEFSVLFQRMSVSLEKASLYMTLSFSGNFYIFFYPQYFEMCGILWYDPFPNILLDSGWTPSIWKFNTLGKFSCIIPLIISSYKCFLYSASGISVNLEFKSFCSVRFSYIIFVCFKVISSSFSCIFSPEFRLIGLGSQMS